MTAPVLVPCLVSLRGEFNHAYPNRDKGADGWIGDTTHQREVTDHNPDDTPGLETPFHDADTTPEVHALDVDADLGGTPTLAVHCENIRLRHFRGQDDRLQNIIYRGRVASRSWGWAWHDRPELGHFDHAHFSARYTTAQENDTAPWGVYREDDDMTRTEMETLAELIGEAVSRRFIATDLGKAGGGDTVGVVLQTGVLGNSTRALELLEQISTKLTPPAAPAE